MRPIFCFLITVLLFSELRGQVDFDPNLNALPGLYAVGYTQTLLTDTIDKTMDTLRLHIWYPSNDDGEALQFSDYMDIDPGMTKAFQRQILSEKIGNAPTLFSADTLDGLLDMTLKARINASTVPKQFPLLMWSCRYETPAYQCILSELLASHGYVVAYVEDLPHSPFPWMIGSPERKAQILIDHITDLNNGLEYLCASKNVDSSRIGVLAWSYAGESAVFTQMTRPNIDLVVGLSGIGFNAGVYLGTDLQKEIAPSVLNTPYLILTEKTGTNGKQRNPPAQFNQMHADSRFVSFGALAHGNFNVIEGLIPGLLNTDNVQTWSKGGEQARKGYEIICQTVLYYVTSLLENDGVEFFDSLMELVRIENNKLKIEMQAPAP